MIYCAELIKLIIVYMMGYGMGGEGSIFALLTWLVVFVDLVLVGVWLWQHVSKK